MKELNDVLSELGISKVRLSKYLGVSRQMLYNYLALGDLSKWPKEKSAKLLSLLDVEDISDLKDKDISGKYIIEVENRLNEGVKSLSNRDYSSDLKSFNKKEQEIISDIVNLMKERLSNDKTKTSYNTYVYLYNFLNSMENNDELRYILAYFSKSLGFTDPMEFAFNEDKQFIFESILFSAMTLYNGGGASKAKLESSHNKFVQDIEKKNEEKLSRTQELNVAKVQALKELGFTEINDDNANEVLEKIAEIQSRKV
jgi:hypothetical protein